MKTEDAVRRALKDVADAVRPDPQAWDRLTSSHIGRDRSLPRRSRRVPIFALTAVLTAASSGLIWLAFNSGSEANRLRSVPSTAVETIRGHVAGYPLDVLAVSGTVWISSQDQESGQPYLSVLDSGTGELILENSNLPSVTQLLSAFGSVWGITPNSVIRFSPTTGAMADEYPIQAGFPTSLAESGGFVWIDTADAHSGPDTLVRLDPATGTAISVEVPNARLTTMAGTAESMWALDSGSNSDSVQEATLLSLAPDSGTIMNRSLIQFNPLGMALSTNTVWVTTWTSALGETGTGKEDGPVLVKLDADLNIVGSEPVAQGFSPLAVLGENLWGTTSSASAGRRLVEINGSTLTVVREVDLPPGAVVEAIDSGTSRVWVVRDHGEVFGIPLG